MKDKALGALIGLAVGDALGAPLEFRRRDTLPRVVNMIGGGPFHLGPGDWTDDTSMAIAMANAIIEDRELVGENVMRRFVDWFRNGAYSHNGRCFDIGHTTAHSLMAFEKTGLLMGGDKEGQGNGSLMRLAPIPIAFKSSRQACGYAAHYSSDLTHPNDVPGEICEVTAESMRLAIHQGANKDQVLFGFERLSKKIGKWQEVPRQKIKSGGYVVDTIKASLWAIDSTNNFEDALILAVNLAGDSDTVGAVTGQIAGAIYGYDSIPKRWIDQLAWHSYLCDIASDLYELPL